MSIREVCEYVSIQRTTCYKLLGSGELEAVKIGSRTLVTKRSVEELIARGAAAASALRKS
ncbi:helix-turn-helix domain-containing protein [Sphingomonas sp.]|uniref:helix-turn-helix domain-containing protein n=1 Tax=Sphingomonas sp. TaxID=28214 RepID=UPI0039C9EC45